MTYSYRPLKQDDSIRLLKIHPATAAEDQIKCDLEEYKIGESPSYEAISYVWGTACGRTSILLSFGALSVTQSLGVALQRFRWPTEPRFLWADAVCINQKDVAERNKQVKLMRRIYENASGVVVWLGFDDGSVTTAVSLINDIFETACRHSNLDLDSVAQYSGDVDDFVDFPPNPLFPPSGSDLWQPLINFFSRDWFERTWIVQEITSAAQVKVFCGDHEISWQRIGMAATWLQKQMIESEYQKYAHFESSNVYEASILYDKAHLQDQDFLELLSQLREFAATDKKDKVFALLGLRPFSVLPQPIQVDYNKSKLEIYRDVVKTSLLYHGDLSILSSLYHGAAIDTSWPTWIPRWDIGPNATSLLGRTPDFENYSSGNIKLENYGYTLEENYLTLHGLVLGEVIIVSDLISAEHFQRGFDQSNAASNSVISFWKTHLNAFRDYRKTADTNLLVVRFCKTMTAALNSSYQKTDRTFGDDRSHIDQNLADYAAYLSKFDPGSAALQSIYDDLRNGEDYSDPTRFEVAASRVCDDRRLFLFGDDYIGLGPNVMQPGDQLCILFGGQQLYILRAKGEFHQLVGECFVHDLMWGEGLKAYQEGQQEVHKFCLC